jgi:hypothetical protein
MLGSVRSGSVSVTSPIFFYFWPKNKLNFTASLFLDFVICSMILRGRKKPVWSEFFFFSVLGS